MENEYPLPQPTPFTESFWDACQQELLQVWRCKVCGHPFLSGGPVCPECWSDDLEMQPVSGRGEVFSFVVYHRTYHPAIPAPYIVASIELENGVHLISNIIDCKPEMVRIGMQVQVAFKQKSGFKLPMFTPTVHTNTTFQLKRGNSSV